MLIMFTHIFVLQNNLSMQFYLKYEIQYVLSNSKICILHDYTWLMLTKGGFYSEGTDMFAKSPNR